MMGWTDHFQKYYVENLASEGAQVSLGLLLECT